MKTLGKIPGKPFFLENPIKILKNSGKSTAKFLESEKSENFQKFKKIQEFFLKFFHSIFPHLSVDKKRNY